MNTSPNYYLNTTQSNKSPVDVAYWQNVLNFYENKNYKESTISLLRYANPDMFEKYGNADKTYFEIPHGSVNLKIRITNDLFSVEAECLKLPESNTIPLLRQAAQINFSPLNLTNLLLKDDALYFQYECPIETCDPYKIWDVLYEICIYADSYDDEFIGKFKSKRIHEPKIKKYTEAESNDLYNNLMAMIEEAKQYTNYFYSKRWDYFCWDIAAITLLKIDHHIAPQGTLRADLEKEINYQMSSKDSHQQRIRYALEFFEKIRNMTADKIKDNFYKIETFISPRRRATHETLVNTMKGTYERATDEYNKKDDLACTLSVQYIFYYILYYYNFEDKYFNEMHTALRQSSGKSWAEAANILYPALQRIMLNLVSETPPKEEKKKGFFSKWFGS